MAVSALLELKLDYSEEQANWLKGRVNDADYELLPKRKGRRKAENIFCPTGPGGGIDPTCKKGETRPQRGSAVPGPRPKFEDYVEQFKGDTSKALREHSKALRRWEHEVEKAISRGDIAPKEAVKLGYTESRAEKWHKLPEELYHVTTAKGKVLKEGLKSRAQLERETGKDVSGLGGGPSEYISLTDDKKVAVAIYEAMREAVAVAKGLKTAHDLWQEAREGKHAGRPYAEDVVRIYAGGAKWKEGEPLPVAMQALLSGKYVKHSVLLTKPKEPGDWEPLEDIGRKTASGEPLSPYWWRTATDREKREETFNFYRAVAMARELAGGPMYPVFFGTEAKHLENINIDDIALLQFKGRGFGIKMEGLKEWRVPTSEVLEFAGDVSPAQAQIWNIFCPTGKGGGIDPTCKKGEVGGPRVEPRIFATREDVKEEKEWGGKTVYVWKHTPGLLVQGQILDKKDLPERLYHVTTAADAVKKSGVLLGQSGAGSGGSAGLGGGVDKGVSFTRSRQDAELIHRELTRHIKIAKGQITGEDFKDIAREDAAIAGIDPNVLLPAAEEAYRAYRGHLSYFKEHLPETPPLKAVSSATSDAFKFYLIMRESAAYKLKKENPDAYEKLKNPVLFGDLNKLAKIDLKQVRILSVPSKNIPDKALITTGTDEFLREVRVYADVPVEGLIVENIFCPTGKGGGIDPTCKKGETRGRGSVEAKAEEAKWAAAGRNTARLRSAVMEELAKVAKSINVVDPSPTDPDIRKELKKRVVLALADDIEKAWPNHPAPGMVAHELIKTWARSAGDNEINSLALQLVAKEKFGLDKAYSEHLERNYRRLADNLPETQLRGREAMAEVAAESIYKRTQEWFKERGFKPDDEIILYRGMTDAYLKRALGKPEWKKQTVQQEGDIEPVTHTYGLYEDVTVTLQPLSSFSFSPYVAQDFAAWRATQTALTAEERGHRPAVIAARVKVRDIFSTPFTGHGCLPEREIIVLGRPLKAKILVGSKSYSGFDEGAWYGFKKEFGRYDFTISFVESGG